MKISAIETIRCTEHPNLLLVRVLSDEGVTGLGETWFGAATVEQHVHDWVAPRLLGTDPRDIERHRQALRGYLGYTGSGAEARGNGAVDIALWDLAARAADQPLYNLLGGRCRESIRVYNTCAGAHYVRDAAGQGTGNFGLSAGDKYDDLNAFLNDAGTLAESLLEMGIDAMKIWPFDYAAEAWGGHRIGAEDLKTALGPFEAIRDRVGDRMDIMAELHGLWHLTPAKRIARALEPFDLMWIEDPLRLEYLENLGDLAAASDATFGVGETLSGLAEFKRLVDQSAVGLVIFDPAWSGGISEARRVATLAEAHDLPIAFHDCTGPLSLAVGAHLSVAIPNVHIQEVVRAFYYGWYGDIVTALPPLEDGMIRPPEGAGLGLDLLPDFLARGDVAIRRSAAA